jgi:hypothetical protein
MAQTKQQKELILLALLGVIAGAVWYGFFFQPNHVASANPFSSGVYERIDVDDYGKAIEGLDNTRKTDYKSSGRNIFVAHAAPPPTLTAVKAPEKKTRIYDQPQPLPPPPPPQLDMKFFGMGATPASGPRCAFLQDKEDKVIIVSEGDVVENRIRITHIGNDRIEFQDIHTGMKNSAILEMPSPSSSPPA